MEIPRYPQNEPSSSNYNPFLTRSEDEIGIRGGGGGGNCSGVSHFNHDQEESGFYPTRPINLGFTETITLDDNGSTGAPDYKRNSDTLDLVQEILTNRDLLMSKGFYFFFYAAFGSLFPLTGVYFKQMGMNSVQAGILTGVRPFIEIFSAPFWGSMADRFNKGKLLLMASMFSWIIFTCSMAYIRPPAAACVSFNETHHILFTPYSDESDNSFEMSITPQKRNRRGQVVEEENYGDLPFNSEVHSLVPKNDVEFYGNANESVKKRVKRETSHSRSNANRHRPPPAHVIGKSPIPIDYTLNFNKDIHASYVSPPFSTVVYKWEDVESVFLLLMLLVLIGEFFSAPAITLADLVTLDYLGDRIDLYGRQRMFGSVGWAISMFLVGMALDNSTEFTNHPCGPHESERNYKVCFYIFAFLMVAAAGIAYQFRFPDQPGQSDGRDEGSQGANSVPMKPYQPGPKPIFNTAPPINPPPELQQDRKFEFIDKWKSAVFAQRTREMPEWVEVLKTFANLRYGAFLFVTWFMGAGIGMVFAFLFWHLQDLGGTPTLFGLASVINHISEIFAYFYSLEYIKKYGHTKVLCFGLACNFGRFLYIAWLDNPWFVLPFELMQGVTHAGVWAACCSYITQATPPHLKSSTQGVLQGLHHGFGRGAGAILGGIFINKFGTRPTFAIYGLLCGLLLAFFIFVNSQRTVSGFRWLEDETEHQVYIEGGAGLAPHGVPSAPIARTASKTNLATPHSSTAYAQSQQQQNQGWPQSNDRFTGETYHFSSSGIDGSSSNPSFNRWNCQKSPKSFSSKSKDNNLSSSNQGNNTILPHGLKVVAGEKMSSPDEPITESDLIRDGFRQMDQVFKYFDNLSMEHKSDKLNRELVSPIMINVSAQQQPNNVQKYYDW